MSSRRPQRAPTAIAPFLYRLGEPVTGPHPRDRTLAPGFRAWQARTMVQTSASSPESSPPESSSDPRGAGAVADAPLRGWIAAGLSLMPGLGHVYCRAFSRAALAVAFALGAYAIAAGSFVTGSLLGLALAMPFRLVSLLLVAIDALILARATPQPRISRLRRVGEIAAGAVLLGLVSATASTLVPWPQAFVVSVGSMAPAVLPGDHLYVDTTAYASTDPERGDIVAFLYPDDPRITFLKRIVGLPGDRVRILGDRVFIDGTELPRTPAPLFVAPGVGSQPAFVETLPSGRSYLVLGSDREARSESTFDVPEGQYFVLGDNRPNSSDSRTWRRSFVPRADLVGRAVQIYFSRAPESGPFRLDRIGPIEPRDPR